MKAAARNKVVLIIAVAVVFFAMGVAIAVYGIPALINHAVNNFYFHEHKAQ